MGDLEHVAVTVLFHTIQQLSKATVSNSLKPNQQNCNLGSLIFGNTCQIYVRYSWTFTRSWALSEIGFASLQIAIFWLLWHHIYEVKEVRATATVYRRYLMTMNIKITDDAHVHNYFGDTYNK